MRPPGPEPGPSARMSAQDEELDKPPMTIPRLLSERYELGETLGYGGMSEVHRGRDTRLDRDVAVKVLRADLARDPQFQTRFRREAQNAAALNHPAIVAVYDTGETNTEYGPLPYIVMEYVEGRTLRDIVKTEGPLDERRATEVIADVCAALDFSHRHGIIHRDVKPANVMITSNGAVKVMDFGIARALADGQGVTQTAAVIGTAQYLSPEQARGELVDPRSDVYATGCVLYELLTGEPPFTGDSPVAVAYQHVREDPTPPSARNPTISRQMDAVVLKSMSKNPANRYQSAAEMRTDLVRVLSGQRPNAPMVMTADERTSLLGVPGPTEAIPGRHRPAQLDDERDRRRNRRALIVLAVLLIAALLAVLGIVFSRGGPEQVAVPDVTGLTEPEAHRTLADLGFVVVPQDRPSTPEQIDKALGTEPPAGTRLESGSTVTLLLGSGPLQVPVPDLTGRSIEEAQTLLRHARLELNPNYRNQEVDDESQVGLVLAQNPPPGQPVPQMTPVEITVGVPRQTVTLINVVGDQYDAAAGNLRNQRLQVVREDVDSTEPAGIVVDQDPDAGTEVHVGSKVTLQVSRGNLITMPDLRGHTTAEAEQILRQLGWTGSAQVVPVPVSDSDQVGTVISHDPAPGQPLRRDQTVTAQVGQRTQNTPPPIFPVPIPPEG